VKEPPGHVAADDRGGDRGVAVLLRVECAVEAVAHVLDVVAREPADGLGAEDGADPLGDDVARDSEVDRRRSATGYRRRTRGGRRVQQFTAARLRRPSLDSRTDLGTRGRVRPLAFDELAARRFAFAGGLGVVVACADGLDSVAFEVVAARFVVALGRFELVLRRPVVAPPRNELVERKQARL